MASILSVTKKPPTTLKRANPRDIDPIINNGLFGSAFIIAVNAANIVIPVSYTHLTLPTKLAV